MDHESLVQSTNNKDVCCRVKWIVMLTERHKKKQQHKDKTYENKQKKNSGIGTIKRIPVLLMKL